MSSTTKSVAVGEEGEFVFQPGDVIEDYVEPFLKVLKEEQMGTLCNTCFKHNPSILRCANCKLVAYCDIKCQRKDWRFAHSVECKISLFRNPIRNIGEVKINKSTICYILRTLAHLKLHPCVATKVHRLYNGLEKCFNDLLSHEEDCDQGLDLLSDSMGSNLVQENQEWDSKLIRKLLGVWKHNSFSLLNDIETEEIGSGLYIQPSFFNHSCRPNAVRVSQGHAMQIRCIQPIPLGSQPCITFLTGNKLREERQEILQDKYNFVCKCDLCEKEIEAPVTDYTLLNTLSSNIITGLAMKEGKTFEEVIAIRNNVLELYKPLFHPFDQRVTNFSTDTFILACEFYVEEEGIVDKNSIILLKLAQDTLQRLELTFGKEHNKYNELRSKMLSVGIKLE